MVVGSMVTYSKVVRLFLYLGRITAHCQNVTASESSVHNSQDISQQNLNLFFSYYFFHVFFWSCLPY